MFMLVDASTGAVMRIVGNEAEAIRIAKERPSWDRWNVAHMEDMCKSFHEALVWLAVG
tara:strand:- start:290 stop:463 length:174 start_codon:yes stop_codon:yes gene_type:complete